ncbi:MAG: amino acid ABC transporter ATP-binding protein [Deltaproteobacteria bacterium]|nr:amino acid ABC transporter ATP-binding protein [Deltaproteobacteria bacterium]
MTASIVVENLGRSRGGKRVLDGVSWALEAGQVAVVMGRSGAGKTTLLRCAVGLDPFERGRVCVAGVEVRGTEEVGRREHARAQARIHGLVGMVFQSHELFPHLSVLRNCTLAPRHVRREADDVTRARARALLDELGVGDKVEAFPSALSGGQRQRVAIARALCMEPRVLFYDEPTSALDPASRADVAGLLRRLRGHGITQVVVAHDVELARAAADVVLVVEDGRVARMGAPSDVLE